MALLQQRYPADAPTGKHDSLSITGNFFISMSYLTFSNYSEGEEGARLTHSHERQYAFCLQSLRLWRDIQHNMFLLWILAERDLLMYWNNFLSIFIFNTYFYSGLNIFMFCDIPAKEFTVFNTAHAHTVQCSQFFNQHSVLLEILGLALPLFIWVFMELLKSVYLPFQVTTTFPMPSCS